MPHDSERWIEYAREDVRMAQLAFREEIYNQVCFHAQQSVEKLLKSLIASNGDAPPRTHKIADLLSLVKGIDLAALTRDLLLLDRFYIPTRYPDTLPGLLKDGMPNRDDALEAMQTAISLQRIVDV